MYDIFAPALDLKLDLSGREAAEIIFPDGSEDCLSLLESAVLSKHPPIASWQIAGEGNHHDHDNSHAMRHSSDERLRKVHMVLDSLPGLRPGAFGSFLDSVRRSHDLV